MIEVRVQCPRAGIIQMDTSTMARPPASSTSSWRNPSAENQAKYNLVPLPASFIPTAEEEELLRMYEMMRSYEKEAARIKEQAAKAKLAAADAKYKQSIEATAGEQSPETPAKKKRARKKKKRPVAATGDGDHEHDLPEDEEESEDELDETDKDDQETLHEKREKKLEEMRQQLEEAKQTKEAEAAAAEEALRAELLAETKDESADTGPSLKRKRPEPPTEKSSLIANITAQVTPPHDFSQKLGLKTWQGKILFPSSAEMSSWTPPDSAVNPNEGSLVLELADFDIAKAQHGNGNNTIAIKFTAPSDAKRFSINIAGPDHGDFHDVLFHFNPRERERGGQLVINDKQDGIWGQGINIPLSQLPLVFGQVACNLILQINGDGFDVFLEDKHCARLEHRRQLPSGSSSLYLQFPSTDDYGNPEVWTVYKVWWGNKSIIAKGDLSGIAGVNVFSTLHPKKLFISGLQRISTQAEVDLRRADLERAFRKYGGDHGVLTTLPTNTTFAFVEFESERQADLALHEMQDHYRLNRARRSRHEALQEERAAADSAKQGDKKESTEWD